MPVVERDELIDLIGLSASQTVALSVPGGATSASDKRQSEKSHLLSSFIGIAIVDLPVRTRDQDLHATSDGI